MMFHGSLVALVTPMLTDGTVDIEGLRQLLEWHIEQGTHGIVVLGSTGEAATLNEGEKLLIIRETMDQVRGRIPVIAGTGTNSTSYTIHLTKAAFELGVDACLLVTPYYNKPTQEGLYLHYKSVADEVPVPLILYNVPSRTACDLKPETVQRLAPLSNIIGLKEATGDISRVPDILERCDGHYLDLYSGDDSSCLDFILAGGKGVISVTTNVAPKLMNKMCEDALKANPQRAKEINTKLASLHELMCIETNPIPVKWALYAMKKISLGLRLPLTILLKEHQDTVLNALKQAGVL
jgi:4-hydroxy-tetrahydrodipicolinate synthase